MNNITLEAFLQKSWELNVETWRLIHSTIWSSWFLTFLAIVVLLSFFFRTIVILRWPLIFIVGFIVFLEFLLYISIRWSVKFLELLYQTFSNLLRSTRFRTQQERKLTNLLLQSHHSYQEWKRLAAEIDSQEEGPMEWKYRNSSRYYDYELVSSLLKRLRNARKSGDVRKLCFYLRGACHKNVGGIDNEQLHLVLRSGTKYLVEEYIEEVVRCLRFVYHHGLVTHPEMSLSSAADAASAPISNLSQLNSSSSSSPSSPSSSMPKLSPSDTPTSSPTTSPTTSRITQNLPAFIQRALTRSNSGNAPAAAPTPAPPLPPSPTLIPGSLSTQAARLAAMGAAVGVTRSDLPSIRPLESAPTLPKQSNITSSVSVPYLASLAMNSSVPSASIHHASTFTSSPKLNLRPLSVNEKLSLFRELKLSYGNTALCLSGGGGFGNFHWGVVRGLLEVGYLPRIISGTSAGAVVAAVLGTRSTKELLELIEADILSQLLTCFDEPWSVILKRLWNEGYLYDLDQFEAKLKRITGEFTFGEAFQRTGRVLNISVTSKVKNGPPKILNYITSPNVFIYSAVLASSALPYFTRPIILKAKDENGKVTDYQLTGMHWSDGSISSDIPLQTLSELFNVSYFIVSQVNPHIIPFFFHTRGSMGTPRRRRSWRGSTFRGGFVLSFFESLLKRDMLKWGAVLSDLDLFPVVFELDFRQFLAQVFRGQVTITPRPQHDDYFHIISDPTPEKLSRYILTSKHETWKQMSMIETRLKIGNTLDELYQQLQRLASNQGRRHSLAFADEAEIGGKTPKSPPSPSSTPPPLSAILPLSPSLSSSSSSTSMR